MSNGKRPGLPVLLSANAVLDGAVCYRTAGGWSPRLDDALVAEDETAAASLEGARDDALRSDEVADPALVSIEHDSSGRIVPVHYRERIRALGPTVRRDLGPQAGGEHSHVSL